MHGLICVLYHSLWDWNYKGEQGFTLTKWDTTSSPYVVSNMQMLKMSFLDKRVFLFVLSLPDCCGKKSGWTSAVSLRGSEVSVFRLSLLLVHAMLCSSTNQRALHIYIFQYMRHESSSFRCSLQGSLQWLICLHLTLSSVSSASTPTMSMSSITTPTNLLRGLPLLPCLATPSPTIFVL